MDTLRVGALLCNRFLGVLSLVLRGLPLIVSYLTFLEGAPNCSEELEDSYVWPDIGDPSQFSWRAPGFFSVWLIYSAAIGWRRSCGIILVSWFSSDKRVPKLLEGMFCLSVVYQGVFSLPSVHIFPWQRRYRGSVITFLWRGIFFCCHLSSYSVEEGRLI